LRVAALVHEVGGYVSSRAHHKHSLYLISNSEVFGLTRSELQMVAHVARYHRRSAPKPTHVEFMALPREDRMGVGKLASLLRIADALDRAHGQRSQRRLEFTCLRHDEELVINVQGAAELTLERRALAQKGQLFEDIFGLTVRLEEASSLPAGEQRSEATD
jgi:exopolyphosphatase/guanosine-5'-triphosphate,3'-diphosphate pyrophosphatase